MSVFYLYLVLLLLFIVNCASQPIVETQVLEQADSNEEPRKARAHEFIIILTHEEDPIPRIKSLLEQDDYFIDEPVNSKGDTILHLAAIQSPPGFTEFLLDNEADPWIINHEGHPPANYAVYYGNFEFLQKLKEKGVEFPDKGALLNYAAFCGQTKIFEWLRDELSAPLTHTEKNGATALHLAAWGGHVDIMKQLINAIDVNKRQKNGDTPLISAAWSGRTAAVKFFIEHGADLDATGHEHHTALWVAVAQGKLDVVKILIEAGADPNIPNKVGTTALHADLGRGIWEGMPELLLSSPRIEMNRVDENGTTPLFFASLLGDADLARRLLEKGADPNLQDKNGYTPLHIAGIHGYLGMADVLLEFGARLLKDMDENTALHVALINGRGGFVELVLNTAQLSVDPDQKNRAGESLLHLASYKKQLGSLQKLVARGGDIQNPNAKGNTPLHIAASNGFSPLVKFLLEEGADINLQNNEGLTPYCFARKADANLGSLIQKLDLSGDMCPWEYEQEELKAYKKKSFTI